MPAITDEHILLAHKLAERPLSHRIISPNLVKLYDDKMPIGRIIATKTLSGDDLLWIFISHDGLKSLLQISNERLIIDQETCEIVYPSTAELLARVPVVLIILHDLIPMQVHESFIPVLKKFESPIFRVHTTAPQILIDAALSPYGTWISRVLYKRANFTKMYHFDMSWAFDRLYISNDVIVYLTHGTHIITYKNGHFLEIVLDEPPIVYIDDHYVCPLAGPKNWNRNIFGHEISLALSDADKAMLDLV